MKLQVKKYFHWGDLSLEPKQYLLVTKCEFADSYRITLEKNNDSIIVSKKALAKQIEIGNIQQI